MGNFSQFFYFYRTVSCVIAGVFFALLLVIFLQTLSIYDLHEDVRRLQQEKIDINSRLKAAEMMLDAERRKSRNFFGW